jgi:Fic family protein
MARQIPLFDVDGRSFSYSLPDEVLKSIDTINRQASGEIALSEPVTNPAMRDRYVVNSLIEEAITSSQIEGASTSRQVAKEMIRSGRRPKDRSERMILSNYMAMQFVSERRRDKLTPDFVLELHRIVTDGTLDDPSMAGRIQSNPDPKDRVAVFGDGTQVLHTPPPVEQLPTRLQKLCDFANGEDAGKAWMPPVLRALTIHFMVGYDHYFEDGNGRTARALFYWSMLAQGYWLTEFLTISKILKKAPAQYGRSFILTEQDDGDLTHFFVYQLRVIERAISELEHYLARKMGELRETRMLLAGMPGEFNYRQLALLEGALKNADQIFTAQSHGASHNVSGETARHDLLDLEKRGLLLREKRGRRYVWLPVPNLSDRLKRVR